MELAEGADRSDLLGPANISELCVILHVSESVYGISFERGSLIAMSGAISQMPEAWHPTRDAVTNASFVFYEIAAGFEGGSLLTPSTPGCMLPVIAYSGLRREDKRFRKRPIR